jgi:protein-L-isoaspartate(D-aspartate) O-methyltransferase
MVREHLMTRDIVDERVLAAMAKVPRHEFVPEELRAAAYEDRPLPIGHDVTISQPYIVALMTQLVEVSAGERVLDVGTGSGYQAAVLAELGAEVWGIEIIEVHAEAASERLARMGYTSVTVRHGDGHAGWREHAPFDAIVVAAAAAKVPPALLDQLAIGGRMVIPVGSGWGQSLELFVRNADGYTQRTIAPVMFVPLVGGR